MYPPSEQTFLERDLAPSGIIRLFETRRIKKQSKTPVKLVASRDEKCVFIRVITF